MTRGFLLTLFLLVGCENITALSSSVCELPCYDGPDNTFNVGECIAGTPICSGNAFIECAGQTLPSAETCNGRDDNCDGKIDEAVYDVEIGEGCGSNVGECETGSWQCYKGRLTCFAETLPKKEICNGKDDNCNGVVDDVGFTDFCYSGDSQTLAFPPCHAGILECRNASFVCLHEVTPRIEICDNTDNNCNGRVDEGLSTRSYDVVFAVDRSCSMLPNSFNSAKQAMSKAALSFVGETVRFAIIVFPVSDINPIPLLISDFTDGNSILAQIASLKGENGSGLEPSYDTIQAVVANTLHLSFTAGASRYLFMWTDEAGQTFQTPLIHETKAADIIRDSGVTFIAFVPTAHTDSFDGITDASNGSIHPLTDGQTMSQIIINNLDVGCLE